MHRKSRIQIVALAVAALALAGCSSNTGGTAGGDAPATNSAECAKPAKMTTATVATNPGSQDLVVKQIKAKGLDKKYNLDLQVKTFQNPPATAQAIVQKSVDLGFGGIPTMVQAWANGADVIVIGALSTPSNGVFVKKDSPYQNLGDLKGKKIGSFSPLNGAVTSIMQAYAQSAYKFNMLKDVSGKVHVAPDAALVGLLDQGQLDAVILGADGTAVQRASGQYRQIVNLQQDFQKQFGFDALYLGPVTTESFAKDHCGVVRAYASAIRDAVKEITSSPDVWATYAKNVGQPAAATSFQELYDPSFVTEWTQTQVDGMTKMIKTLTPYLDPTFPKEVDHALFSLDYPAFEN
jgi:ABC-type nitrate/sulfonate/bicarbonate transport system substrate-binding protein